MELLRVLLRPVLLPLRRLRLAQTFRLPLLLLLPLDRLRSLQDSIQRNEWSWVESNLIYSPLRSLPSRRVRILRRTC